ncbi:hypothetical protein ACIQOV_34585, partial [Kitasatospora sp. NPDC091257]
MGASDDVLVEPSPPVVLGLPAGGFADLSPAGAAEPSESVLRFSGREASSGPVPGSLPPMPSGPPT